MTGYFTLPDAGRRFMSLLTVNEDHYALQALYAPAKQTFTREKMGTRYFMAMVRTFMNPNDAADVQAANAAQDGMKLEQAGTGTFEVPESRPRAGRPTTPCASASRCRPRSR